MLEIECFQGEQRLPTSSVAVIRWEEEMYVAWGTQSIPIISNLLKMSPVPSPVRGALFPV